MLFAATQRHVDNMIKPLNTDFLIILGAGINLTFIIYFLATPGCTWGYSHSTPTGLCFLISDRFAFVLYAIGKAFKSWCARVQYNQQTLYNN